MDLVHQNSSSSGLSICSSLGVLSADNRMSSNYSSSGGSGGPLSPNLSSMKQCRSASDVEVETRDEGGPLKLARKDSFSYRQSSEQQKQQQLNNGGGGAANNNNNGPAGSNSFSGDNGASRIACSPTNSCLSDGVLVATDAAAAANLMGDNRMLRPDGGAAAAASGYNLGAAQSQRPFSYQSYQYAGAAPGGGAAGAGSPLMLAAAAARGDHLGMQTAMGMRGPFTANQWAELEHQALIFKYMMAGASVPPELLNPIRRSVALNTLASSHPSLRMGWGNFHLGIPNNPDPEPGRCRRTDGKKWRCSREVVPDQKYCDRHMHRGRNRSKKNAENQAAAAAAANSQSAAAAAAGAPPSGGNVGGVVQSSSLNQIHSSLRPPLGMNGQQNHQHAAASASPFNTSTGNTNKSTSNFNSMPAGIPSSNNSGSSLQFPMQSLSGASPGGNKDYRYMNGMTRPELGLGAEQLLFSDSPGLSPSWQQHQQQQSFGKFPRLSSNSNTSSSSSTNTSSPLYQHQQQQQQQQQQQSLRSFSGGQQQQQHFGLSEANHINHHHPLLNTGYGAAAAASDHRDSCEEQPLRHFFDDWPRHRDPSAIPWNDIDDESQKQRTSPTTSTPPPLPLPPSTSTGGTPTSSGGTHLSISLPMSSSPDFPRGGRLSLSPLKLSMRSEAYEDQGDPTSMGLGMGNCKQWMVQQAGGPLAEVLHSSSASTPRSDNNNNCNNNNNNISNNNNSNKNKTGSPPGLNLLGDASWESSSRETSRMASPTAVLKTPFGSFSDSSSNASSPRAVDAALLSKQL